MEALLALAILTAGAGAIWAGITDPAGNTWWLAQRMPV